MDYGEAPVESITWGGLHRTASRLAGGLRANGSAGRVVLLPTEPGLGFVVGFVACLYAGAVPAPVPVPDTPAALRRLSAIAAQADAHCLLHRNGEPPDWAREIRPDAEGPLLLVPVVGGPGDALPPPEHRPAREDTALVQYSSGSTGDPKGVIVTHGNIAAQAHEFRVVAAVDDRSVFVSWLPLFHDMGLMTAVLLPAWSGGSSYFMTPRSFLREPVVWLDAISRFRATHTAAPNFVFDLCVRRTSPQVRDELDLSSLHMVINGAEPVRLATLQRFAEAFGDSGFDRGAMCPGYGLAEATLAVTMSPPGTHPKWLRVDPEALRRGVVSTTTSPGADLVSCGPAQPLSRVLVVGPDDGRVRPHDGVGEIWVSGPSIAAGYRGRPDLTERTFRAELADDPGGQRFLRTGDLGFVHEGELYVTGRLSDLIIIRGVNHYPEAIEATVAEAVPEARTGHIAVFVADDDPECDAVVVALELRGDLSPERVVACADAARHAVETGHDLVVRDVRPVAPGGVARTTSGKVARRRCRDDYLAGRLPRPVSATSASDAVPALLDWVVSWSARRLDPSLVDERRTMPPHVVLDLAGRGLLGIRAPTAAGGLALGHQDAARVLECLASVDLTLATFVCGHNFLGVDVVSRFAADPVRERLLARLASGRALVAFAWTEPGASHAVGAMSSTATPLPGGGYRLDGRKLFIGSAGWADTIVVFARLLDEDGQDRGPVSLVVPSDAPGVRVGAEALTMGLRGMTQNEVVFDGVVVRADAVLGEPGNGGAVAESAMTHTRLMIGALCVGAMKRLLRDGLAYAAHRRVSTGSLLDNSVTLARLDSATSAVATVEALVSAAASALDRDEPVPPSVFAAVKVLGPELLWEVADDVVQLLGGRGYVETNDVPRFFRDARVLRVLEGPTEAMRMHLGAIGVHRFPEVSVVLRDVLPAAPVHRRLREVLSTAASPGAPSWRDLHRRYQVGAVVAWGYAAAAVHAVPPADPGPVAAWVAARLDHAVRDLDEPLAPSASVERLTAIVNSYGHGRGPTVHHEGLEAAPQAASPPRPPSDRQVPQTVTRWLTDWIAQRTGTPAAEIDIGVSPLRYGLDSVTTAALVNDAAARFGVEVSPQFAWGYPTIAELGGALQALVERNRLGRAGS
ncbi:AMP-binding protein [Saccharothrix sp. AJ9571]|nr:AMP-binding protein [Saccharothrix sp. AJ9571]